MAHYAQIDENNIVTRVIVAEQEFIDSGAVGDPATWIQTSYNTRNGHHMLNGTPLRANYAGIGFIYHPVHNIFSPPSPHPSHTLNTTTGQWESPVPHPDTRGTSDQYKWDENTKTYVKIDPSTWTG
jgi:hypothetical protein